MKVLSAKYIITAVILLSFSFPSCSKKQPEQTARPADTPSPFEPETKTGTKTIFAESTLQQQAESVPLEVQTMDVETLSDETKMGKKGDILITFSGRGFFSTEHDPEVSFGKLKFTETYTNESGTELYIIIPRDVFDKKLMNESFREISIMNPDKKTVNLKSEPKVLKDNMAEGKTTAIRFSRFGVLRGRNK